MSSPHDSTSARGASAPAPAQPDDIAAEIADHLATTAERLKAAGVGEDEAKTQAAAKFGDAAAISRRCYWIQQGDSLMFRGAVIALLSILCLGLTITAVASWQSQARMAQQMTALTEQLKALAEKQVAVPPPAPVVSVPAEPKPLVIEGLVYDGEPTKPVPNAAIVVMDMKDGREIRTVKSDASGKFSSGPLAGGDYSLAARPSGSDEHGRPLGSYFQYAPVPAYSGAPVARQQLDVSLHAGAVSFETSRPLPQRVVGGRYVIDSRLLVGVISPRERSGLWSMGQGTRPGSWPLIADYPRVMTDRYPDSRDGRQLLDLLSREEIDAPPAGSVFATARFPAGSVTVGAVILADIWPVGYRPQPDFGQVGGIDQNDEIRLGERR